MEHLPGECILFLALMILGLCVTYVLRRYRRSVPNSHLSLYLILNHYAVEADLLAIVVVDCLVVYRTAFAIPMNAYAAYGLSQVCMFCYLLVGSLHAATATSKLATVVSFARVFNADPERVARRILIVLVSLMAVVAAAHSAFGLWHQEFSLMAAFLSEESETPWEGEPANATRNSSGTTEEPPELDRANIGGVDMLDNGIFFDEGDKEKENSLTSIGQYGLDKSWSWPWPNSGVLVIVLGACLTICLVVQAFLVAYDRFRATNIAVKIGEGQGKKKKHNNGLLKVEEGAARRQSMPADNMSRPPMMASPPQAILKRPARPPLLDDGPSTSSLEQSTQTAATPTDKVKRQKSASLAELENLRVHPRTQRTKSSISLTAMNRLTSGGSHSHCGNSSAENLSLHTLVLALMTSVCIAAMMTETWKQLAGQMGHEDRLDPTTVTLLWVGLLQSAQLACLLGQVCQRNVRKVLRLRWRQFREAKKKFGSGKHSASELQQQQPLNKHNRHLLMKECKQVRAVSLDTAMTQRQTITIITTSENIEPVEV